MNFKINNEVFITENEYDEQAALFNYNKQHWFKVNKSALALIKKLESFNYEEIDKQMKTLSDYDSEKFKNFINFLIKNEYIKEREIDDNQVSKKKITINEINTTQKVIWLSITNKCNLKCIHCYNTTEHKSEIYDTVDNILKIISKLDGYNVGKIILTGGEPFLHKWIYEIIEEASKITKNVDITTNGLLINESACQKLKNSKVKQICVSVDGITRETHEHFRGKNTFEKVLKNIKLLKEHGLNTHIISTINRINMEEIIKNDEFLNELGVTGNYSLYTPVGNGKNVKDELMFTEKDFDVLNSMFYDKNSIIKENKMNKEESDNMTNTNLPKHLKRNCGAGYSTIGIEDDGRVVPCHLFLGKDITLGNILVEDLSTIIERWVNNGLVTVDEIDKCKTCSVKYFCGGGCMAHRYGATGSMTGVDPYCFMNIPYNTSMLWNLKNKI